MSKRKLIVIGLLVLVVIIYVLDKGHIKTGSSSPTTQCQVSVTVTNLNVRSAASPTAPVVGSLANGTITAATSTVQNGFRELSDNKWVDNNFVKAVAGNC